MRGFSSLNLESFETLPLFCKISHYSPTLHIPAVNLKSRFLFTLRQNIREMSYSRFKFNCFYINFLQKKRLRKQRNNLFPPKGAKDYNKFILISGNYLELHLESTSRVKYH